MSGDNDLLLLKLRDQIEFYFSARNLQADTYLLSKMDKKLRVPVDVVAGFQRIKDLTKSPDVLLKAVRESPNLAVHEEAGNVLISPASIKPALRVTVILRDVPDDCTDEEIEGLFEVKPAAIRTELKGHRYLDFKDEEQAIAQHRAVSQKKLRGEWVKARVKSESLGINMLVAKHSAAEAFQADIGGTHTPPADPFSGYSESSYPYMYMPPPPYGPMHLPSGGPPPMPMWYEGKGYPGHPDGGKKGGFKKGGFKGGKKGAKGYYGPGFPAAQTPPMKPQTPQFTPEDFPTLVQADGLYEKEVIRWGKEDIIRILGGFSRELQKGREGMKALGVTLPTSEACCAVLGEANYNVELTRPMQRPAASPFVEAVKKGTKKAAPKPSESPATAPAQPAAAVADPKPEPVEVKAEEPVETQGEDTATPSPESPSKKNMSWAEAVITASDVKVSQPYVQYRAGISGNTVLAPGGSTQKTEKKKEEPVKGGRGGKGEGRGKGGRGRGEEGRGSGKGGRGTGGKKDGGEKGAADKGAAKGSKKEGKKSTLRAEAAPIAVPASALASMAAAAAAAAKPAATTAAAPAKAEAPPSNSWAAVAMGLSEKKDPKPAAAAQ